MKMTICRRRDREAERDKVEGGNLYLKLWRGQGDVLEVVVAEGILQFCRSIHYI